MYSVFNETSPQDAQVWITHGLLNSGNIVSAFRRQILVYLVSDVAQWRRRLVIAYEVKAGMVYLQGKSYVIHT